MRCGGHVAARGGIAGVTDGGVPGEAVQGGLTEHIGNVAQPLVEVQFAALPGADAGSLLASVLEGIESQVGLPGGFGCWPDAEYATFILECHGAPKT